MGRHRLGHLVLPQLVRRPNFLLVALSSERQSLTPFCLSPTRHHIDIHCWMVEGKFKPVRVNASAAKGIATSLGCAEQTEDTITLLVEWEGVQDPSQRGVGVYTASWAAPMKAGVHVSRAALDCLARATG